MRLNFNRITIFYFVLFSVSIFAQDICIQLNNAKVVADDGQYLGKICSEYNSESIINNYGTYGSEYNSKSIWNKFGQYGNEFSLMSPFNDFTTTPPMIIKNGVVIGYLTKNKSIKNAVDPYILLACDFY